MNQMSGEDVNPDTELANRTQPVLPPIRQVEGREWWLWVFAVAVTLVLTFAILSLTFPVLIRKPTKSML